MEWRRLLNSYFFIRIVLEYVRVQRSCNMHTIRAIVKFPVSPLSDELIERTISKQTPICTKKEIIIAAKDFRDFLTVLYGHHNWFNDDARERHVLRKFPLGVDSHPITIYLVDADLEKTVKIKKRLRRYSDRNVDSFHSTDTQEQTDLLWHFLAQK